MSKLSPWVLQLELDAENNKPGFSERKWYELHEKASLALRPTPNLIPTLLPPSRLEPSVSRSARWTLR